MVSENSSSVQDDQNDSQKVEPIKDIKAIKEIKVLLTDNPRNSTLFTLGINTNLMPNELLHLQVHQVRDLKRNDTLVVNKGTDKEKSVTINRIAYRSIQGLLASEEYKDDDHLFKSQRGNLIVPSLHRLVTKWCEAIGINGNYGSHTLRKTWGYHQFHTFGTDLAKLMKAFNHTSQKQTREYLCLDEKEDFNIFLHEL